MPVTLADLDALNAEIAWFEGWFTKYELESFEEEAQADLEGERAYLRALEYDPESQHDLHGDF